jgi:hypothetical protein
MLVECTTCKFKKMEQVKGFQASNYAWHYRLKHPNIAYNKESEKTRAKKTIQQPFTNDFFNISSSSLNTSTNTLESRKRIRQNTITEFNENDAYTKILTFIVENNLLFNILNTELFKDLLSYYNKFTLVINQHKIKVILNNTFNNTLSMFNDQL